MNPGISRERLAGLLVDPREALDFEAKNWLDLRESNEHRAIFAKACLAMANHGGGFVALGLTETDTGVVEADGRPPTLDAYSQDHINGIIQKYCDPPFHCTVYVVPNPDGALFPIAVVPGGHRVPVRSRRGGPNGNIVTDNAIYVRRPGPRSEVPQSAREWDDLLARCLRNRRDEMLDQIRDLISGAVRQVDDGETPARFDDWVSSSQARWRGLAAELPEGTAPTFPHGWYRLAYEVSGERRYIPAARLPEALKESVVRLTGWPPFWYPTRAGIEPYPMDGAVECWLGGDPNVPLGQRDPARSDFWRIHPEGLAFLLRGYQEDGTEAERAGRVPAQPATAFDVTLPVWRVGEALLHARSFAGSFFEGTTVIRFSATYEGLEGRSLVSIDGRRHVSEPRIARQNSITLTTRVGAAAIDPNLPEIVHSLLSPLYALFDFFELPSQLVTEEISRLRARNY
ncbi:MAG: hypothetical protein OXD36_09370 [Rhodobacter sp.]|nr:hypothetical protein [Rhodobacter sp.]